MCYRMLSSSSVLVGNTDSFLYSGDLVKHGCVIDIEKDLPGVKEQCLSLFFKAQFEYCKATVRLHIT